MIATTVNQSSLSYDILRLVNCFTIGYRICVWCIYLHLFLGGGFRYFLCSPLFGEDEPILTSIFFKGVETTN